MGAGKEKAPATFVTRAFLPSLEGNRSLTVTYSHMATSHTTIGAERFHFRVRNGIGWFPLAFAVRQKGNPYVLFSTPVAFAL